MESLSGPIVGIARSRSLEIANVIVLALRSRGVRAAAIETSGAWDSLGSSPHAGSVVVVQQADAAWAQNILQEIRTDAQDADWSQASIDSLQEFCTACGYPYQGLKHPTRCPECGTATGLDIEVEDAPNSPSAQHRRTNRLFARAFRAAAAALLAALFLATLIAAIATLA